MPLNYDNNIPPIVDGITIVGSGDYSFPYNSPYQVGDGITITGSGTIEAPFSSHMHENYDILNSLSLSEGELIFNGSEVCKVTSVNSTTGDVTVDLSTHAIIKPVSDSTTAIRVTKANGSTDVITVDTSSGLVGVWNNAPSYTLDVADDSVTGAFRATSEGGSVCLDDTGWCVDTNLNVGASWTVTVSNLLSVKNTQYSTQYSAGNLTGGITITWTNGDIQYGTMTGNVTSVTFASPISGGILRLRVAHASSSYTMVFGANTRHIGVDGNAGKTYTLAAGTTKRTIFDIYYDGTDYWVSEAQFRT